MNLEETHISASHSSGNWKSLSFVVKEWVMTPSDIVSGEVEFTGCRVGGTHSKGPLLLTPSLSLKRDLFTSLDTCRHPGELTPGTHILF